MSREVWVLKGRTGVTAILENNCKKIKKEIKAMDQLQHKARGTSR